MGLADGEDQVERGRSKTDGYLLQDSDRDQQDQGALKDNFSTNTTSK